MTSWVGEEAKGKFDIIGNITSVCYTTVCYKRGVVKKTVSFVKDEYKTREVFSILTRERVFFDKVDKTMVYHNRMRSM